MTNFYGSYRDYYDDDDNYAAFVDKYLDDIIEADLQDLRDEEDIINEYVDGLVDDGDYDDSLEEVNDYLLNDKDDE